MADFSYYHGTDAEQFNFFRLPKKLIQDPQFASLSGEAKILYGVLLDRMTLSAKNGWLDEENRIYIIYTVKEVEAEFNCCTRKAISLMAELDNKNGIGLIEKKRQGLGKPNIIFVKNFNLVSEAVKEEESGEIPDTLETGQEAFYSKKPFEIARESAAFSDMQDCAYPDMQEYAHPDMQERAYPDMQERAHPDMQEYAHPDMQKCASLNNKTNNNKTNNNYNTLSIYPSRDKYVRTDMEDRWMDKNQILEMFKEKLEYQVLLRDNPYTKAHIDEIFKLMADTCSRNKAQSIGGTMLPITDIRERFDELKLEHIRYVLQSLRNNTTGIKNIRAYLLTCLYNAPTTMGNFYQAEVNHTYRT